MTGVANQRKRTRKRSERQRERRMEKQTEETNCCRTGGR